jgi:hypothetical protein
MPWQMILLRRVSTKRRGEIKALLEGNMMPRKSNADSINSLAVMRWPSISTAA